jgi:CRISPR-associated protein Csx10
MARIEVSVSAESPLSLGTTKAYGGTLIATAHYIGGGHLRGALGAVKQYLPGDEQEEIDHLLGTPDRQGIVFPNCYPSMGNPTHPVPLTAYSCKRAGGFKSAERGGEKNHGVADTLLMQLAYDYVAGGVGDWKIPLPFRYRCPECGNRTEPHGRAGPQKRFVEYGGPDKHKQPVVSFHRQTRVAINRTRQTAEESQLYSVQAIDEGSAFFGMTEVDDRFAKLACKWLERIERIGGRTSRGFGRVQVKAVEGKPGPDLAGRLGSFNSLYRRFESELTRIAHEPLPARSHTLFTIDLRSDALLRTQEGLPTLTLTGRMLRDALFELSPRGEVIESLNRTGPELIAQYTQPKYVSGWQTIWKLPKEVLLASSMGGLYVFAADTSAPSAMDLLAKALKMLEAQGIGEMREDGYGQITVCDPFHLEVNPV